MIRKKYTLNSINYTMIFSLFSKVNFFVQGTRKITQSLFRVCIAILIVVWSRNVWHSWRSGGFCKTLDAKTKICRGLAVCILILQRVPTPPGALRVNTLLRPALGPVLTRYNENLGCGIIWTLSQSVLCVRTVNGKENYLSELLYCCQVARSV